MKIAIIGTGIAGNVLGYHLHREHDITVFEANDYVGGHTHTHDIDWEGQRYTVDSGFIVFNEWTYPNFIALLDELGVVSQPSNMSFSVRCERSGLEYNGRSLNGLFAQRRNLVRPSFLRMLRDIIRFNRDAKDLVTQPDENLTLGSYVRAKGYSRELVDHYLIPMGSAIWSTDPERMFQFPAVYFARFLNNHGMLNIWERPTWRVIQGGSRTYVEKLTASYRHRIRLRSPVQSVRRLATGVEITPRGGERERFDYVFLACHSDQALSMLVNASPLERAVLGAIPYQHNEAVLHTDTRLLPRRRQAWAAWNYHLLPSQQSHATLTYNMNILQSLDAPVQFLVTLNNTEAIDPGKIIKRLRYEHPLHARAGVAAQQRQREINGAHRSYFCGAYWRYGFHEDGVVSALDALNHFKQDVERGELHLPRTG